MNIRDEIVQKRKEKISSLGPTFGHPIPAQREFPIVPFSRSPLVICEIKKRSPSRGNLNSEMDVVAQAGIYKSQKCPSVSVLTEEDFFGGSLMDLYAIKKAHPELALLRKDFLIDRNDIDVAFRAGADAILLIASMLEKHELEDLHNFAKSLGLEVLVEVHSKEEVDKVSSFKPPLMGINCRDLETFALDRLLPLEVKNHITWNHTLVYESGLFSKSDAVFAHSNGFAGILVGEAVVKNPERVQALRSGLALENPLFKLWSQLNSARKPLVKICGLTREIDAREAFKSGADLLGFIFAQSPRRANIALLQSLKDLDIPKIAVVVARSDGEFDLGDEIPELFRLGLIDAVQFSGNEKASDLENLDFPFYKVVHPDSVSDLARANDFSCPRILLDSKSKQAFGGTGIRLDEQIMQAWKAPLWLAGGLNTSNIRTVLENFKPELVDVASGIESEPGIKNHEMMRQFIEEVKNAHY